MHHPPFSSSCWLQSLVAGLRRGVGQPHAHTIGQPQIDHGDVARQKFFVMIERDQPVERSHHIGFRQPHIDAVGEPQIPAPLRHQDRGAQLGADIGIAVDDGEEILGRAFRAFADHERQPDIAAFDERFEHRAVGGDDADAAVLLPDGKSLPFGHRDLQAIGIKFQHRRIANPRIGHQPLARGVGVEEQQRSAAGDAGGGEDFLAADFLRAGQRNRGDPEADRIRHRVAGVLEPGDQIGKVLALDDAIAERAREQQHGSRDTDARRQALEPRTPASGEAAIGHAEETAARCCANARDSRLVNRRAGLPHL